MREDVRARFNVTAAWEWFKTVEGYPYGYHNFIFGWFDTPDKSLPPITDIDFLYVVFELVHNFIPAGIDSLVGEALNKRLGTHNYTL
jgi:predicted RecB family nuclease